MAPKSVTNARNARKRTPDPLTFSAMPEQRSRVGASVRTIAGVERMLPTIVLRGEWLVALGFPIGAPIHLMAEADGRLMLCRPGLKKPRWLRIVAA